VNNYGAGIGTIRFADYGLPAYRGWSLKWGAEQLTGAGTAGLGYETLGTFMALTDAEQRDLLAYVKNIAGFLYAGGSSASNPDYLGQPGTVYRLLKTPVSRTVDGKLLKVSQIQDNADTNTLVRQLLVMVAGLTDPEAIAAAVREAIAGELDAAQAEAIAAAVSSSLGAQLTAALGEQLPGAVVDELVERARE
jgi:hypothetical protein